MSATMKPRAAIWRAKLKLASHSPFVPGGMRSKKPRFMPPPGRHTNSTAGSIRRCGKWTATAMSRRPSSGKERPLSVRKVSTDALPSGEASAAGGPPPHTPTAAVVTLVDMAPRVLDFAQDGSGHTRGDQHVAHVLDLVHRRTADLAYAFGHAVHAVDVRLAEQAAVCIDGQTAVDGDCAALDEILGLAATTETKAFDLREHERREGIVEHRRLDVRWTHPGLRVQPCRGGRFGHDCEIVVIEIGNDFRL